MFSFCSYLLMALITKCFFLSRLKLKRLKNGGAKIFNVTCVFLRIITFLLEYKSDIVLSVFLSQDQI